MTCPTTEIKQTLFLGCSISNFKCSLGWNESASTINIRLVRDECSGTKTYYDLLSNPIEQTLEGPDPGFNIYGEGQDSPPEIGAPCYFRFGDFEFCGLLQSWQKVDPGSDKDIYDVILASPTELLQGVNLILGDYAGQVKGFNILNVYGWQEYINGVAGTTYTQYAGDGPLFGSAAGGFGGADWTEAGMPWTKVRDGIRVLTSCYPNYAALSGNNNFSQYGRVCFVGSATGGYGLLPYDSINIAAGLVFGYAKYISNYILDISDIPVTTTDYRIPGPTADLLTVINQVCQDLAHDYYVELIPVAYQGTILKVIKFRPVSRISQPPTNIVSTYVNALTDKGVIASSYGQELRNESTTNFLIGGQKQTMYQAFNGIPFAGTDPDSNYLEENYPGNPYVRDVIVPYFGSDFFGDIYIVKPNNTITVKLIGIKHALTTIGSLLPNSIEIPLNQIYYAGMSFDDWISTINWDTNSELYQYINAIDPYLLGRWGRAAIVPNRNNLRTRDAATTLGINRISDEVRLDLYRLYGFINGMYNTAQTTFMVRIPYTNARWNNGRLETTDSPAIGGWTENPNLIGLANPGSVVDFFKNEDGSIHSIASFLYASGLQVEGLDNLKCYYNTVGSNNVLYTEVEVEDDLVFLDRANAISPRVLIHTPNLREEGIIGEDAFDLSTIQLGLAAAFGDQRDVESQNLKDFVFTNSLLEPSGLAIAFQSNVNTYGPWKPNNVIEAGPPGRITIQKDDTLVPWTYGSYSNMNNIAQLKANASVGGMNIGENGSVTVDGYPSVPLGAELASLEGLGSSFYTNDNHLYENRSFSSANVSLGLSNFQIPYIAYGAWSNAYGPNVTSIDVSVDPNGGVSTSYVFRTYSPKFGTLNKSKSDLLSNRIKEFNKMRAEQRFAKTISQMHRASEKRLKKFSKRARLPDQINNK